MRYETDLNPGKMNSTKTHWAWFTGCINFTIRQLNFPKLFASLAYKRNICYVRWISNYPSNTKRLVYNGTNTVHASYSH